MTDLKRNLIYNCSNQVLNYIIPLLITPYISRVIGASGIGIYAYGYTVASYFALFILLGLNVYGNKTIAAIRDDKEQRSKVFWELYLFQLFMGTICLTSYIIYASIWAPNAKMSLILCLYVVSVCLDVDWFFSGMEQFKITVLRSTCIKMLNLICIFLFIKNPEDVYRYGFILAFFTLLRQLLLYPFLKNYISFCKISISGIEGHIKPNLKLFIPVIAVSIYKMMDKIMLGNMTTMQQVGFYENSEKLINIPIAIIGAVGAVMMPRITNMVANGKKTEAQSYMERSLLFSVALSSALSFGLITIAREFVPFFFGEGYEECINVISMVIISAIFISWTNILKTQYLMPNDMVRIFNISTIVGALVNLVANAILIPYLQAYGAAIGTVMAELSVCIYQYINVSKQIPVRKYLLEVIPFPVFGFIMALLLRNVVIINNAANMVIKIILGGAIFIALCAIYYFSWKNKKRYE